MKTGIFLSGLVAAALVGAAAPALAADSGDGWKVVWQDDFDGDTLNKADWKVIRGNGCPKNCGFGNNELQTYAGGKQNLRLEDGKLVIEARKSNMGFTSAKITSEHRPGWTYGRIEMRAKLPSGVGTWPAFWMMPDKSSYGAWPKSGEIDIMEHVGFNQNHVHGTIHTEAYNHRIGTQKGKDILVPTASDDFHTYGIEWTADHIRWFIDGAEYYAVERQEQDGHAEWPFDHAFHVILNFAVGGDWGGKEGVDPAAFPARYEIDWVRVSQQQ